MCDFYIYREYSCSGKVLSHGKDTGDVLEVHGAGLLGVGTLVVGTKVAGVKDERGLLLCVELVERVHNAELDVVGRPAVVVAKAAGLPGPRNTPLVGVGALVVVGLHVDVAHVPEHVAVAGAQPNSKNKNGKDVLVHCGGNGKIYIKFSFFFFSLGVKRRVRSCLVQKSMLKK